MNDEFDYERPPYYSDWRERTWTCPSCHWQGPGSDLLMEAFNELSELWCPGSSCQHKFGLLVYPGHEATKAAAEAGNAEAQVNLQAFERVAHRRTQRDTARDQDLPDLAGEALTFTFIPEGGADSLSPHWLVLTCNGTEIYREPSGYEAWQAIIDISLKVIERYPNRISWIDPADAGHVLLGDSISAAGRIREFLAEHNVAPPTGGWATHG